MDQPKQSYIIWFTPRTGSSYFSELLATTDRLGTPGELFNIGTDTSLGKTYGVSTYEGLKQKLWKEGSSSNAVFGIKFSLYHEVWVQVKSEIHALKQQVEDTPTYNGDFLWELFPRCQHIYLTRRNKIRQAVSWWKAIKKGVWHIKEGEAQDEAAFYKTHYDFDALSYLLTEISVRECATEAFFKENHLTPMTLVYEDLIQDKWATLDRVSTFLGQPLGEESGFLQPATIQQTLQKTSSSLDEEWIQRFREDLQQNWSKRIW